MMNRIQQTDPDRATGKTKQLFDAMDARLGRVPNLVRVVGNSPAALEAYLNFSGALTKGVLSAPLREQIALAVGEINGCGYCLSAHSSAGAVAGLSQGEAAAARFATGNDEKSEAVLDLVWAIMVEKGQIDDSDVEAARKAGLSDEEIVEVVANIALTIFTNHVNQVARTVIDYPEVVPRVISDAELHNALFSSGHQESVQRDV